MFLFIGSIAVGAWLFTNNSNDQATFEKWLSKGSIDFNAGDYSEAIESFQQCLALNPTNPEIHHNLACCFLRTGQWDQAITHANEVVQIVPGDLSAQYLAGCALVRQGNFSDAVQRLNQLANVAPAVAAVKVELGRAYRGLNRFEDAAAEFRAAIGAERGQPAAERELAETLALLGQKSPSSGSKPANPAIESGLYNQIIATSEFEQPSPRGIPVRFTDLTPSALGPGAIKYTSICQPLCLEGGPGIVLLAGSPEGSVAVVRYTNGVLSSIAPSIRTSVGSINAIITGTDSGARTTRVLVFGDAGTQRFQIGLDGKATEESLSDSLTHFKGRAAVFANLELGGLPSLIGVDTNGTFHLFEQTPSGGSDFPTAAFHEKRPLPETDGIRGISDVLVEDINHDDWADVILPRGNSPPLLLLNQGGHGLASVTNPQDWPSGSGIALGDLNNDKRIDVLVASENSLNVFYGGRKEPRRLPARHHGLTHFRLIDYDQDGWLDIVGWGKTGLRVWRNRGWRGFHEVTVDLGFGSLANVAVESLVTADFDNDGDSDWLVGLTNGGIRYWRNDGANVHALLKLCAAELPSYPHVQGLRVELDAGNWHTIWTVGSGPTEIGVGRHSNLTSVLISDGGRRWFGTNLAVDSRRILEAPMAR